MGRLTVKGFHNYLQFYVDGEKKAVVVMPYLPEDEPLWGIPGGGSASGAVKRTGIGSWIEKLSAAGVVVRYWSPNAITLTTMAASVGIVLLVGVITFSVRF